MKKSLSILVHLEMSMWGTGSDRRFDENVWTEIVDECVKYDIDTIVLDLGRGIQYGSHPELAQPWAWSREKVRGEVKRLKDLGIALIPKLNFSAVHDAWLGEYGRMISTSIYYKVCRELITEVYGLFDKPKYIHLGMDEEDGSCCGNLPVAIYRQGEQIWFDLQYLCDCVRDMGATPWIWADYCMYHPEEFRKHIKTDDIVISPWMYYAIKKEHWTPISSDQKYIDYYGKRGINITYVEEDPEKTAYREQAIPAAKDGYKVVPCVSLFEKSEYNTPEVVEYFKNEAPDGNVVGFMTAPWKQTSEENKEEILESIRVLKKAREEFYGE